MGMGSGGHEQWEQSSIPIAMPPPGATETTGLNTGFAQQSYASWD